MPAKLDRCVKKVKKSGTKGNPWAICKASLKRKRMKRARPSSHLRRTKKGKVRINPHIKKKVKRSASKRGILAPIDDESHILFGKGFMSLDDKEEREMDRFDEWAEDKVKSGELKGDMQVKDAWKTFKQKRSSVKKKRSRTKKRSKTKNLEGLDLVRTLDSPGFKKRGSVRLTKDEEDYIFDTYGLEPEDLPSYEVEEAIIERRGKSRSSAINPLKQKDFDDAVDRGDIKEMERILGRKIKVNKITDAQRETAEEDRAISALEDY